MLSKRNRKNVLFSVPILYLLFAAYLIGNVYGSITTYQSDIMFSIEETRLSFFAVLVRCFIYYASVVLFARTVIGFLIIPAILFFRGFIFGTTVVSLIRWSGTDLIRAIMQCGLPAMIQLFPLFYLSSICFALSLRRVRHFGLNDENVKELKGAMIYSTAASFLCAAISNLMNF